MAFVPPDENEIDVVNRLQKRLQEERTDIANCFTKTAILRFFRGRKNVEENAFKALIKHSEWRKENDVNNIEEKLPSFQKVKNSGLFKINNCDKDGRPIVCIDSSKHDKNDRNLDELKLVIIHTMETVIKMSNPNEQRMVICFDLTGFSFKCMDYDALKVLVNILSYNYPETLSVGLILNAPFIFYACWAIIKPWLDPVTAAKVQFVDEEQLKSFIGDSDSMVKHAVSDIDDKTVTDSTYDDSIYEGSVKTTPAASSESLNCI